MMLRLLELALAAAIYALLLSPLLALAAGGVVLVTGLAFVPVFAPMTTLALVAAMVWLALRDGRRRRRGNRAFPFTPPRGNRSR
jgi:hypothetical protein